MNLEFHISELLYRFPCVPVPGFGAFITENIPAQVLGSATSFIPPRKKINFNSHIKHNDGLLVNHVAAHHGISFEKATEQVAKTVKSWLLQLENKEAFTLDKIGIFTPTTQSNFIFSANEEVNYLTTSYGLMPFITPEITRVVQEEIIKKAAVIALPISKPDVVPIKKYEYQPATYSFGKYAAAFALICTAGLFGYKMYFDKQVETQTLYVQKEVQKKVATEIQNATFAIDFKLPTPIFPAEEALKPYHLIFGAFRNPENAEKALKQIQEQGYDGAILPVNGHNLIPVSYGSFATELEATQIQTQIKQKFKSDVWILID